MASHGEGTLCMMVSPMAEKRRGRVGEDCIVDSEFTVLLLLSRL